MNGELVQLRSGRKPKKAPDTPSRLVLTLAVAGFLSGLAIVGAYEITRPMIAANQQAALRRAVFEVVPGAERLQRLVWRDGELLPEPAPTRGADEPEVYGGYGEDGEFLGYAIPTEGAGYQDTIQLIYGFVPDRSRVVGMQVLESRETPGLGDRIYKDQGFVGAFRDLAVEPRIELVKEAATADNEVAGITGATISSQAVVRIINQANELWLPRLPEAAPPLREPAGGGEEER
jgi:electron transport complex protein RnfG